MVAYGHFVELTDEVALQLLLGVVEGDGRNLELVDLKVLEPLGMAGNIDPSVVDRHGFRLGVQGGEGLHVLVEVLFLVVNYCDGGKQADCASLLVTEAALLEVGVRGYLAESALPAASGFGCMHCLKLIDLAHGPGEMHKHLVEALSSINVGLLDVSLPKVRIELWHNANGGQELFLQTLTDVSWRVLHSNENTIFLEQRM